MNEKTKILIIAPLMDIPTITSNEAVYDILKYLETKYTIDTDIIWGPTSRRFIYNIYTKLKNYDGIFYLGHGERDRLFGNQIFRGMIDTKNISKAKNSIIATMACFSGDILGKIAIKNGIKAYIGTTEEYFAFFPEKERDFLKDWRDITTTYFKDIIDGKTVGEAYGHFQERGKYYLNIYQKNLNYRNFDWYYNSLAHNLKYTVLLGDPNARLFINKFID